jgi:alginate O-acetyltransferase complex protein AlgI
MQIYFDFSGYSDMAIGLGRMFGFRYLENFDYPYSALGIQAFWRKWHISLSTWFRDYVYIPLGGNRRGKPREALNKFVVFFLTGFWHGASWTFIIWGLFHGVFITLEATGAIKPHKMPKFVAWLYTMLVVVAGFVAFRANTLEDAKKALLAMFFGVGGIGSAASQLTQALRLLKPSTLPALAAAAIASFPVARYLVNRAPRLQIVGFALSAPLFFLCILNLATATYNPFIYYRF